MLERPVPETSDADIIKKRRAVKPSDIIASVVIIVVIGFLVHILMTQLSLKHEVASARVATGSFLTDIKKQDAATAYKFGDSAFESKYTQKELANLFTSLAPLVKNNPTVIKQTADNGKAAQVVSIYYQFSNPKYFFAVTVKRANGTEKWELINFSGSPTQADLFKTQ